MFDALSRNEFLLIVVLVLTGYYVFVSIFFFGSEISLSIKGTKKSSAEDPEERLSEVNQADLLGKAQPDVPPVLDHITNTDSDQLQFSVPDEEEGQPDKAPSDTRDALLLGIVADILEEVKTLVQVISECEGDEEESISMFQSLLSKYPRLGQTKFRIAINMFIQEICKDQFAFDLTMREIDSWWPNQSSQNH